MLIFDLGSWEKVMDEPQDELGAIFVSRVKAAESKISGLQISKITIQQSAIKCGGRINQEGAAISLVDRSPPRES